MTDDFDLDERIATDAEESNRMMKREELRDMFAAKALIGYSARMPVGEAWPSYADIARWAYEQADAMLQARESK